MIQVMMYEETVPRVLLAKSQDRNGPGSTWGHTHGTPSKQHVLLHGSPVSNHESYRVGTYSAIALSAPPPRTVGSRPRALDELPYAALLFFKSPTDFTSLCISSANVNLANVSCATSNAICRIHQGCSTLLASRHCRRRFVLAGPASESPRQSTRARASR